MIQTLYEDAVATREWLSRAPRNYKQWLRELRDAELRQLKTAEEPRYLYRSQGRVEILDRFLGLEQELLEKGRS